MRIVKSNKTVKASTNLEPRERTAVDGKTWWVVFDKDTQKYSTLTCFGKYKSKKDCQYAIDKYNKVGACNDVKASNNGKSYKDCLKDALIAKGGYKKSDLEDQELRTLESWAKDAGIDVDSICACGDVKASRTAKEKFLGTALLENRDDGKIHLYNFPVAPNDRCRYMWNNTMFPTTWNTIDEAIDAIETTLGVRVNREQIIHPTDDSIVLYLYGTNKAIMSATKVSANDQALAHIKAAIDILGKSGNKDEVTKDSIANLSVVLFDIKASSGSCKYSKAECINAIKDQYGYTNKEAEQYYKEADCKTLEALVEGFKSNAKKTFYDD